MTYAPFNINTSAMLVDLSISNWTAKKLDKKVSEEVDANKATKTRAGNYHKNLLAGSQALEAVIKYGNNTRLWHHRQTLPWSDSGTRIITMDNFLDYKAQLVEHENNYNRLVNNFVVTYPTLISAAAFQLGDLFNRDEYPEADVVAKKFKFNYVFSPLPSAGDFRVDIGEQAAKELVEQYETTFNNRIESAMKDVWDRVHDTLTHMSDRLADADDGSRKTFHKTLLTNASEMLDLMQKLNITKDPQLEAARQELSKALLGVELDDLKESTHTRKHVKTQVDEILSKFEW
jgi:hypothetical protein